MKKYSKQVYVAWCIEGGERFYTLFMTSEKDPVKIHAMGMDEADQWGAQCWEVVTLEEAKNIEKPTDYIWDMDLSGKENLEAENKFKK